MTILGWLLLGIGAFFSLLFMWGDIQKTRSMEPYAGIGLWAPEVHVVLALLTGGGSWMLWGWIVGIAVFVGHSAIGMFVGLKIVR